MIRYISAAILLMLLLKGYSQVGIGTKDPNQAAVLHVTDNAEEKGVLIPDVSDLVKIDGLIKSLTAEEQAEAVGMTVFLKPHKRFYTWDGANWICVNPFETDSVTGTISPKDPYDNINGTFFGPGSVPIGGIIMWSGNISSLPPDGSWALCDGRTSNSMKTPDLRGRFIVGYGASSGNNGSGSVPSDVWDNNYSNPGDLSVSQGNTGAGAYDNSKKISIDSDNLPSHNHTITISTEIHSHPAGSLTISKSGAHQHQTRGSSGLGSQSNFRRGSSNTNDWVGTRTDNASYDGSHTHTVSGNTGSDSHSHTATIGDTGNGDSFDIRPPYYVLAFIMRVK